jgi:subtilisin family serine protease
MVRAVRNLLLSGMLLVAATDAAAQVGLPAVRLPSLPPVSVPALPAQGLLPASGEAAAALGELDSRSLRELRQQRIRELLRRHRDVLEADPNGAPIVRGELLAFAPDAGALQAAAAAGYTVIRERALAELGARIVVLHAPDDTARSLARLRGVDPAGNYDFNHVFLTSGAPPAGAPPAAQQEPEERKIAAGDTPAAAVRVGLIDDGVDAQHAALRAVTIHAHGCAAAALPAVHGTAIASLLAGHAGRFRGAAPGAELYAADVFCGRPSGGAVDEIAEAFTWLMREQVAVINVSLVGPANRTLESVVAGAVARGYLIVAAVGNDGPAAPPLYPAAWPGVVGVTAVDARRRVLPEAARGPQVKFAAPGADMTAALTPRGYALVRGTSFAAPIVAGLLAQELHSPDKASAAEALAGLERRALHLGAPGLDPVFGYGLVGAELAPPPMLAGRRLE